MLQPLAAAALALQLDSAPPTPAPTPTPLPLYLALPQPAGAAAVDDTTRRRRSVDLSDGYYTRLTIHRRGTYAMIPLFAAQAVLGERIFKQKEDRNAGRRRSIDQSLRIQHRVVAIGVDALFALNTVTGVWNLYEARRVPERKTLRIAHSVMMLASDAGFAAASTMGFSHEKHRNIAYGSLGLSAASAAMMFIFK